MVGVKGLRQRTRGAAGPRGGLIEGRMVGVQQVDRHRREARIRAERADHVVAHRAAQRDVNNGRVGTNLPSACDDALGAVMIEIEEGAQLLRRN